MATGDERPSPPPASAVTARLRRLSTGELRALVAALWRARGFDVRVDGGVVHVERDGRASRLHVAGRRRVTTPWEWSRRAALDSGSDDDGADGVLVAPRREGDGVVDAAALYDLLVYGVDRGAARELFETHLGLAFVPDDGAGSSAGVVSRRGALAAGAALAGSGLVGAALAGAHARTRPASDPSVGVGTSGGSESAVAPGERDDGRDGDDARVARESRAERPTTLAPGVTTAGVVDVGALARAHAALVTGSSYRWDITYRERVDGVTVATGAETVRVEGAGVYLTEVRNSTPPPARPAPVDSRSAYADGVTRYVRFEVDGETLVGRSIVRRDGDRMATRAQTYVGRYLAAYTAASTTEPHGASWAGYRQARVTVEKTEPTQFWPGFTAYHASAVVDERGFVERLAARGTNRERTVETRFVYTDVGSTSVETPAWVLDADGGV